ncbi:glycoside hydrolase family 15 protein [Candidatus Manganitrophus noduliformans]|uniref:glycoside hydrolase family 15 protein n=1 Tax=Candidatus Manganitrophus noduliformans TaxID=2606439 RepID=UPI0014398CB5|nr:glycoside hydrolase family 15 protein [Candidatus Manganitrophus noduliformans]
MGPYQAISDYGVVGNLHTAALISSEGSIDWACFPHFDSPAVFCRLLDIGIGGYFQINLRGPYKVERSYLERTNVLSTTFSNGFGTIRVIDLMPIPAKDERPEEILRKIEGVEGEVDVEIRFKPTPDYARRNADLHPDGEGALIDRPGSLILFSISRTATLRKIPWRIEKGKAEAVIRIARGEILYLLLDYTEEADRPRAEERTPEGMEARIARTVDYWRRWAGKCRYAGPYEKEVVRSALTLKLLTFAPAGGIVAAATTSLPESIGGVRNWDYRFSWLRDAVLTLYALLVLGYREEAAAFFISTFSSSTRTHRFQIMYRIDGGTELPEETLPHLEGYRRSRPVRVGNAAAKQLQLDTYGALLDTLYTFYKRKDHPHAAELPREELRAFLKEVCEFVVAHWREPDHGIWEFRDRRRHFVHSKVMCWLTLDLSIKLAREQALKIETRGWEPVRDEIRETILKEGYDPELGSFVQAFGEKALDASALLFPILGFIDPADPRMVSTVRAIEKHLMSRHFVYRYIMEDGLPDREGTFLPCSFWLVDALSLMGEIEEADARLKHLLSCANDLGLYAEEIDPITEEHLGNFPQAFTHVALISAAVDLEKAKRGQVEKEIGSRAEER